MYGATEGDDLLDEHAPLRPLTPYAKSKIAAEEALRDLGDQDFSPTSSHGPIRPARPDSAATARRGVRWSTSRTSLARSWSWSRPRLTWSAARPSTSAPTTRTTVAASLPRSC